MSASRDSTKDPSKRRPDDRKVVELGVLTIDKAVPNSDEAKKKHLFLPGLLTDGLEQSDDPMIDGHAVGGAAEELHPAASAAPPDGKAIIMAPRFIGLRRWTGGKRRPPRFDARVLRASQL